MQGGIIAGHLSASVDPQFAESVRRLGDGDHTRGTLLVVDEPGGGRGSLRHLLENVRRTEGQQRGQDRACRSADHCLPSHGQRGVQADHRQAGQQVEPGEELDAPLGAQQRDQDKSGCKRPANSPQAVDGTHVSHASADTFQPPGVDPADQGEGSAHQEGWNKHEGGRDDKNPSFKFQPSARALGRFDERGQGRGKQVWKSPLANR